MYKEIPVQSRLIEKRFIEAENNRRKAVIQQIMQVPVHASQQVNRSATTAPSFSRKNQVAYMRHVEIETVNRKLLDNMNKIMQSDYKSAVKTAISNPPRKITSLNARAKKENSQRIAHENQLMLNRLMRGKSTFSVEKWEQSHQKRQKLLKRFGVHPYVLNQKNSTLDASDHGNTWQSSTKIGVPDNVTKYNFPLGLHYPLITANTTAQSFNLPISNTIKVRDSYRPPKVASQNQNLSSLEWNNKRHGSSPIGFREREDNVARSMFLKNKSPTSVSTKKKLISDQNSYPNYNSNYEPSVMSQPALLGSPRPTGRKLTESNTVVNRQASILDENRIVLFKKGKRMGRGYYIIEISSCHTTMFITAYNVEKPQSLILQIPEKRARFILEQFDHNVEKLATCLTVANNNSKLILLNPHYSPGGTNPSATGNNQGRYSEQLPSQRYKTMMNFSSSDGAISPDQHRRMMANNKDANKTIMVDEYLDQTISNQDVVGSNDGFQQPEDEQLGSYVDRGGVQSHLVDTSGVINVVDGAARELKTSQDLTSTIGHELNQSLDNSNHNNQQRSIKAMKMEYGAYNTAYDDKRPWHKRGTGKAQSVGSVHQVRRGLIAGKPRTTAQNNRAIGTAGIPSIEQRHSNIISGDRYFKDSRNDSKGLGSAGYADEKAELNDENQNSQTKIALKQSVKDRAQIYYKNKAQGKTVITQRRQLNKTTQQNVQKSLSKSKSPRATTGNKLPPATVTRNSKGGPSISKTQQKNQTSGQKSGSNKVPQYRLKKQPLAFSGANDNKEQQPTTSKRMKQNNQKESPPKIKGASTNKKKDKVDFAQTNTYQNQPQQQLFQHGDDDMSTDRIDIIVTNSRDEKTEERRVAIEPNSAFGESPMIFQSEGGVADEDGVEEQDQAQQHEQQHPGVLDHTFAPVAVANQQKQMMKDEVDGQEERGLSRLDDAAPAQAGADQSANAAEAAGGAFNQSFKLESDGASPEKDNDNGKQAELNNQQVVSFHLAFEGPDLSSDEQHQNDSKAVKGGHDQAAVTSMFGDEKANALKAAAVAYEDDDVEYNERPPARSAEDKMDEEDDNYDGYSEDADQFEDQQYKSGKKRLEGEEQSTGRGPPLTGKNEYLEDENEKTQQTRTAGMAIEKLSKQVLDDILDKDSNDNEGVVEEETPTEILNQQQFQHPSAQETTTGPRFRAPDAPLSPSEDSNDIYGDEQLQNYEDDEEDQYSEDEDQQQNQQRQAAEGGLGQEEQLQKDESQQEYSDEEFDEEVQDGLDVQSAVEQQPSSQRNSQQAVKVDGNTVEGETIADVAVFSAMPLSTPNEEDNEEGGAVVANDVTPGRSEGQATEVTAMGVRNEPNVRPETQQTTVNNQVLIEYSQQQSNKQGSHDGHQQTQSSHPPSTMQLRPQKQISGSQPEFNSARPKNTILDETVSKNILQQQYSSADSHQLAAQPKVVVSSEKPQKNRQNHDEDDDEDDDYEDDDYSGEEDFEQSSSGVVGNGDIDAAGASRARAQHNNVNQTTLTDNRKKEGAGSFMNQTESEINMTEKPRANNLSDRRIVADTNGKAGTETVVSENKAYSFELEEDEATPPGTSANNQYNSKNAAADNNFKF